jgi:putative membrane protein
MYFMHGFGGGRMGLLWLLLAAGLVVLFIFRSSRLKLPTETSDSTMRTLKERYAREEIGREEYEQKARDIRGA